MNFSPCNKCSVNGQLFAKKVSILSMSILKVAITGHTKGLGKESSKRFDDVLGFSSSNGYDVSDDFGRVKIMHQIKDCDVFY